MQTKNKSFNWMSLCGWFLSIFFIILISCKKLVSIPEPVDSITTTEVFATDAQAISAVAGIYTQMTNTNSSPFFANGATTLYPGLSADEIFDFYGPADDGYFDANTLQVSHYPIVNTSFWAPAYSNIYEANAIIAGLAASSAVHDSVKNELTGEAKFIRAFCYFYLANLFGDIPLPLSTDFHETALLPRSSQVQVYKQIVDDLKAAQNLLESDYSVGLGERIRPNKWAATALLARAYLYTDDWANAEAQATAIINNTSLYNLVYNLNYVFNANSVEAIWQLKQNTANLPFNATQEGVAFIPSTGNVPTYNLTNLLLNSFEIKDLRRQVWVDSTIYQGSTYYYPFKYTLGPADMKPGSDAPQYYMILRLAEQYLIRGEARAQQNKTNDAASDLNAIRTRAGLSNTTASTQPNLFPPLYHKRQIDLFA